MGRQGCHNPLLLLGLSVIHIQARVTRRLAACRRGCLSTASRDWQNGNKHGVLDCQRIIRGGWSYYG
jgi:hypothetical protein